MASDNGINSTAKLPRRPPNHRFPLWKSIIYATPQLVNLFQVTLINTWFVYFHIPIVADERIVSPINFAVTFLLGRLIGAVAEPIILIYSDQCKSSLGRRRPFLIAGPLAAVSFSLLWLTPLPLQSLEMNIYFFGVFLLYNIAAPLSHAPYTALIADLARDPTDRAHLGAAMGISGILGTLLIVVVGLILDFVPGPLSLGELTIHSPLQAIGVAAGLLMIPSYLGAFFVSQEFHSEVNSSLTSISLLWSELLGTLKNPAFRALLGVTSIVFMGITLLQASFPFLATEVLEGTGFLIQEGYGQSWAGVLSLLSIGVSVFFVSLVQRIVHRQGKRFTLILAGVWLTLLIASFVATPFMLQADLVAVILSLLISPAVAAMFSLPRAVYSDVVNNDHRKTVMRKDGLYASANAFSNKICVGLATAVTALIVSLNLPSQLSMLCVLYPMAAGFVLLGTLIFTRYPFT